MTTLLLRELAAATTSAVERRLLGEYGAIFLTTATPPPAIIFNGPEEVARFQSSLSVGSEKLGEHLIELQKPALASLIEASSRLKDQGLTLSARAPDAARRSYDDTVSLWTRNVTRGLQHWLGLGRIEGALVERIQSLPAVEQVGVILELEAGGELFFGTFFDRSILYSVAAPGASQHLSMLAFDVAEYQDGGVEAGLEQNGWFRTVVNDLPHFTYLGRAENDLEALGLKRVERTYGEAEYHFWIPDL
jgi:hypothetical protein